MNSLAEIEKAADALPAAEQMALVRRLNENLAREAGNRTGWLVPPPNVPLQEIERIEALIEAEFSQVDSNGW
jgi:hypothetical protein